MRGPISGIFTAIAAGTVSFLAYEMYSLSTMGTDKFTNNPTLPLAIYGISSAVIATLIGKKKPSFYIAFALTAALVVAAGLVAYNHFSVDLN